MTPARKIQKVYNFFLCLFFSVIVSGCGFTLHSFHQLSHLPQPIFIDNHGLDSFFSYQLHQRLKAVHLSLTPDREKAHLVIAFQEMVDEPQIAASFMPLKRVYQLNYLLEIFLYDVQHHAKYQFNFVKTRFVDSNLNQVLGAGTEQAQILAEIRQTAVNDLLYRLPIISEHGISNH